MVAINATNMSDCYHEEADTRIVVHVMHALENGANVIQVRTVDTYVVVILVGTFHEMSALHPLEDIWVAFGMGKNFHFLSIKSISEYLGKEGYQLFIHLRDQIQHQHSVVKARSLLGKPGNPSCMLLTLYNT